MLISKKSPRPSQRFASRFGDGGRGDFPLQQYLRRREDLALGAVHALLTAVLLVLIIIFGRALDGLFRAHGAGLNPLVRLAVWVLVALFALSVMRRLYYKLVGLRQIRREMNVLRASFRQAGDDDDAPDGSEGLHR
jgi:hypothetical protein